MYVYYFEFVVRGAVPSEQGDSIIFYFILNTVKYDILLPNH